MKTRIVIMLLMMGAALSQAFAQTTVSGTVNDSETKEGLVGAAVKVKDTQTGTSTDASGNFTIEVPAGNNVLVISFLGYVTQEVTIDGKASINVLLVVDQNQMSEVVITGTQTERKLYDIPKAMTVISAQELQEESNISIVDALNDRIGIWVEKNTSDASDPLIRGFSGYYIHAFVDGNSLSSLRGEGGPAGSAMYGKIDPLLVERIEVIRGPSAVLYGSNGLGGVINFITREPMRFTESGFKAGGSARSIFTSAALSGTGRIEFTGACKKFRFLIGGLYQQNNDVRGGGDIGRQTPSSARRYGVDIKGEVKLNESNFLNFSGQGLGNPYHRNYYLPLQQDSIVRIGASVGYKLVPKNGFLDRMDLNLYYQYKIDHNYNSYNSPGAIAFLDANTYAADLKFTKNIEDRHRMILGFHYNMDVLTRLTGTLDAPYQQAPDANWSNIAGFFQEEWNIGARFTLIPAIRFDYYRYVSEIDSTFKVPEGFDPQYFEVDRKNLAITGGLGIVYKLIEGMNLTGNVSRGFRQPEPQLGVSKFTYGVTVPYADVGPETAYTYELALKMNKEKFQFDLTGYYTMTRDMLVMERSTFNGSDYVDYDGDGIHDSTETVYQRKNSGKGYVTGIEFEGTLKLNALIRKISSGWFLGAGFNYMTGKDVTNDVYYRSLSPMRFVGKFGFKEPNGKYWCYIKVDAVQEFDKVPPTQIGSDPAFLVDPQDPTSEVLYPLPGYTILSIYSGWRVTDRATLTLNIENMLDKAYRAKDMRMDAAGIDVQVGATVNF